MVRYWQTFVALTDELFLRYPGRKLKIDNSAADWDGYNQRVLDFLAIPWVPEPQLSPTAVQPLLGRYQDRQSGREFNVRFERGELTINLFLNSWTRLVCLSPNVFVAEGWPFEINFEMDELHEAPVMRIGGRDVDYLPLVGTVAEYASVSHCSRSGCIQASGAPNTAELA